MPNHKKAKVGVSQCLLGDAVRYDGKSKPNNTVINQLNQIFELIPICPEVEAGLGVPRPAVQLTENPSNPNIIGRDDPSLDVTLIMHDYCKQKMGQLQALSGFIFKSRSPSCGLNSTPVYIDKMAISLTSRGVFARAVTQTFPDLPVIEDIDFEDSTSSGQQYLDAFIARVNKYHSSNI